MTEKNFEDLWEKEFWTQAEVAQYFRVVPSTVKNWREQGLLTYWQAPGSTRVLYSSQEVKDFKDKNTIQRKGGDKLKFDNKVRREPSDMSSSPEKVWRI